jgi:hypothetical protein
MAAKISQDVTGNQPARKEDAGRRNSSPFGQGIDSHRLIWVVSVVLAATVLLVVVAAFLAWRTLSIPFPGLFTEPTLVVNGLGDKNWNGYAAGLRYQDHLIALDGRPLDNTRALIQALTRYQPGDIVSITARGPDAPYVTSQCN